MIAPMEPAGTFDRRSGKRAGVLVMAGATPPAFGLATRAFGKAFGLAFGLATISFDLSATLLAARKSLACGLPHLLMKRVNIPRRQT